MAKNDIDNLMSIGMDIGKDTFHLVGFDSDGNLVLRKKIKRLALNQTFEKLPRCIVGMEACLSAHFVSRTLRKLGFDPRIIPAIYVKPFIKGQKNDYNDAEAIAEAALRPNLPPSFGKSVRAALCGILAFGVASVASSGAGADTGLGVLKKNGIRHVNPIEASQLIEQVPEIVILDIRTPQEFNQSRIKDAINIDYYGKDFKNQIAQLDKDAAYLVHCRSGARSGRSLKTLQSVGLKNITHMDKGFNGWQSAGLPAIK